MEYWKSNTYHVDAAISRYSNNCVERPKINTHNRHLDRCVSLCIVEFGVVSELRG